MEYKWEDQRSSQLRAFGRARVGNSAQTMWCHVNRVTSISENTDSLRPPVRQWGTSPPIGMLPDRRSIKATSDNKETLV